MIASIHHLCAVVALGFASMAHAAALPSFAGVRAAFVSSEALLVDRHGAPLSELRVDRGVRRLRPRGRQFEQLAAREVILASRRPEGLSLHNVLEARVAVVPGLPRWFGPGAQGNLRICFSTSMGIVREALDRVEFARVTVTRFVR